MKTQEVLHIEVYFRILMPLCISLAFPLLTSICAGVPMVPNVKGYLSDVVNELQCVNLNTMLAFPSYMRKLDFPVANWAIVHDFAAADPS